MSEIIDTCEDSDDDNNGERPNTASVPSLPNSGKRPRDEGESSYDFHTYNNSDPGVEAAKRSAGSKYVQVVEHRESRKAKTHPIDSDSNKISRDYAWSANEHSQKRSNSKHAFNPYGRRWEDCLSELADYRKIHGHCNVPQSWSENTKLAYWVKTQRSQYKLHAEGKTSFMTASRIKELESLGFKWKVYAGWDERLSELADYRKINGHCNVPQSWSENTKLAYWVKTQRSQYKLHAEGKTSFMTASRIKELESLGFEWNPFMSRRKGTSKKSNLDDDATSSHGRDVQPSVPAKEPLEPSCDPTILQEIAVDVDTTFQQKRNDTVSNCDSNVLKVVPNEEPLQCGLRPPDERRTRSSLRATPNAILKVESESSDSDSEADANEKEESMSMETVGHLLRDLFHSDNAKIIAALHALDLNLVDDEKKCELIYAHGGCFVFVKLLEDSLEKATVKFPQQARAQVTELTETEELHTLDMSLFAISCLAAGHDESKAGISLVGGVKAVMEVMKSFPKCHDLQVVSCCLLGSLTFCDTGKKKAVEAGAMVVLLAAANNHLNSACVCAYTCWALSNIIDESKENTKELIDLGGATAVIKIKEKWPAHILVETKVQSLAKSIAMEITS
jgi:hypothetical protein